MYEAIRKGAATDALYAKTHIKPYFIDQMRELVELEERILAHRGKLPPDDLESRGWNNVGASPAELKRDSMKFFKQSLKILGTCVKEAPEFAARKRRKAVRSAS